jgi:glycosyltransferase involved in cell wall biosynthesis
MARSSLARWLVSRFERLVVRSADLVLCNTIQLAGALRSRYPGVQVEWIPNGVDHTQLPARSAERLPGLAITYVGTIYGGRDFSLVLRALRALLDAHPAAMSDGTMLRVAGHVEPAPAALLARQIDALGLHGHVEMLGVLARSAALDLVARSGLALVLAQQQEYQVPAKLYELIGLGIPTVVVAEEGSAAGSEAVRLGAWRVDEHDVAGLTSVLVAAWRGTEGTPPGSVTRVDYMAIAADADRVLRHAHMLGSSDARASAEHLVLTNHVAPHT